MPFAQQQEEGRACHRPHQRAHAAHDVEDHDVAGDHEEDEVGRGELVLDRIEHAGQAREEPGEHDGDDLVALDGVADGAGPRLVLADGLQHHAERRLRHAPEEQEREGHDREHEPVEGLRREARRTRGRGWRAAAGRRSARSRPPSPPST